MRALPVVGHRRTALRVFLLALLASGAAVAGEVPVVDDPIFDDDFESGECETWSQSSSPLAAPDVDEDLFGDQAQPTVVCQLPAGFLFDVTDCDDGDATIHPGASETCNGIDDDCDAATLDGEDDAIGAVCGGSGGVGICSPGVVACAGGAGLFCSGETLPEPEICDNGLDDDCDGAADGADLDCP